MREWREREKEGRRVERERERVCVWVVGGGWYGICGLLANYFILEFWRSFLWWALISQNINVVFKSKGVSVVRLFLRASPLGGWLASRLPVFFHKTR